MIQRPPAVALDIGCGSGGAGHALRERFPGCALWGCELDTSAAQMARKHFDHVVDQDVETVDWPALGPSRPFDLVCLFDVLEHLVNPWQLLQGLQRIIAPDAHLLVSLPNVSNLPLLYDALRGHWRYRSEGLLDFTHLRFFGDFDARKMFYQTGYRRARPPLELSRCRRRHLPAPQRRSLPDAADGGRNIAAGGLTARSATPVRRQNLYLISPHQGQFRDDAERSFASSDYPQTYAFGAG